VRVGTRRPVVPRPALQRRDVDMIDRLSRLRNWRKEAGQKMGVPSDVVLPRDMMQEIAARNPADLRELRQVMKPVPWRFEHFGKDLLDRLQSKEDRKC
jgi:ribonuclease D